MSELHKPLLDVLSGKDPERVPIWLMRQAGRYLPEYRALRSKAGNFLDLCLNPQYASEITIQPIRRFDFDAAILFADILLIPMALGQKLEFKEGEGPVLERLSDEQAVDRLTYDENRLVPVFETLKLVAPQLPGKTTLIGFCGGMWTVAAYMIDGNSKQGFPHALAWAKEKPELMTKLVDKLLAASEEYLCRQIENGAECLQIFESWAGTLDGALFNRWVVEPTQKLVARVKQRHPNIPIIGFPREAKSGYEIYIQKTGVDGVSLDQSLTPHDAVQQLQKYKPLQGNLDPALLVEGGKNMETAAASILDAFGRRHIFNLGHGVVPQTPPENVAALVEFVRGYKSA